MYAFTAKNHILTYLNKSIEIQSFCASVTLGQTGTVTEECNLTGKWVEMLFLAETETDTMGIHSNLGLIAVLCLCRSRSLQL